MNMKRENRFRAIRNSFKIRVALEKAWTLAYMSHTEIAEDAIKLHRVGITAATISRYMNSFDMETGAAKDSVENNLTEENILWLCTRWGVEVKLNVKVKTSTPNPDELVKAAKKFDVNDIYT